MVNKLVADCEEDGRRLGRDQAGREHEREGVHYGAEDNEYREEGTCEREESERVCV